MTDYDRTPMSAAERVRWRVGNAALRVSMSTQECTAWTDERWPKVVATFSTPGLAAEAVWAHNVMVAAREQRALGVDAHDGCVPKAALVQAGWQLPDAEGNEDGLHALDDEWGHCHVNADRCRPVYVLDADREQRAMRGEGVAG